MSTITKRYQIEGRVQGVGFSYTTRQIALGFDVIGWIKNLVEGSLELVLEGEAEGVEEFILELTEESPLSHHIKAIHQDTISELEGVKGFTIIK